MECSYPISQSVLLYGRCLFATGGWPDAYACQTEEYGNTDIV